MGSRSNKSHGAPFSTPKPGGTTRRRPKPGDKSPDKSRLNPRKPPTSSKPDEKEEHGDKGSVFRDWRGTEGAVEDAQRTKKK